MNNDSQFEPTNPNNKVPAKKPPIRDMLIGAYAVMTVLVTLYQWLLGPASYKGFWFNFGKGVFWPATVFPWLGQLVGGVIWIGVVIALFWLKSPAKPKDRDDRR